MTKSLTRCFTYKKVISIFVTVFCVCLLSACGQRGPLYLPETPPESSPEPSQSPASQVEESDENDQSLGSSGSR